MSQFLYKGKKIIMALLIICLLFISVLPVHAYSDTLNEINMSVYISEDGYAHISETWITEVGSGTENYKVFENMSESEIINFSVIDENGYQFENIGNWDVNKSKDEKSYKCGMIHEGDRYELCWGVGDYGYRQYTIQYTITNFVKQYQNDQGFNYAFLSDMDLPPEKVYINISSFIDLTDEMSDIYGFGYTGTVLFQEGNVVLESEEPLSSFSKVQLLMRIDDGTFDNIYQQNLDFQDILDDAKEDSDYVDDHDDFLFDNLLTGVILKLILFSMFIWIIPLILIIYQTRKRKTDKNTIQFSDHSSSLSLKNKDINIFRDIPCQKDIYYFYYIALKAGLISEKEKSGLIAATLLTWIKDRQIEFIKIQNQGRLKNKEGYAIDIHKPIHVSCSIEAKLHTLLKKAAGEDGILETKEFEKWSKKHYNDITFWFFQVNYFIEKKLKEQNLLNEVKKSQKTLLSTNYSKEKVYDIQIKEDMEQVIGFKKFLKDMSLMDEKEVIDVKLWEDYLIFATILGMADHVEKQLNLKCPEFNETSHIDADYTTKIMRDFTYRSVSYAFRAQDKACKRSHHDSNINNGSSGDSSPSSGGSDYSGGGGGRR